MIVVLFLLVNMAYLQAMSLGEIATSNAVAADAAGRILGPVGSQIMSLVVVVAVFGSLSGTMLASPRLPFALGQDVPRLARLASVHKVFQTPYVAVVVTTSFGIALLWSNSFEQLAERTSSVVALIWLNAIGFLQAASPIAPNGATVSHPWLSWCPRSS